MIRKRFTAYFTAAAVALSLAGAFPTYAQTQRENEQPETMHTETELNENESMEAEEMEVLPESLLSEIPDVREAATEATNLSDEAILGQDGSASEIGRFTITDRNGQMIRSVKNTSGDTWFYLPAGTDRSVPITYTGDIVSVTGGMLDKDAHVITGVTDRAVITYADGKTDNLLFAFSNLPSLYLTLHGTTLETVHQEKISKYPGNDVILVDPMNHDNDLKEMGSVEFKGRGNTSFTSYDKKGYQIKFEKKRSVLGMDKAKKWVLLPNSSDPTMIRNALGFTMAKEIGLPYTSDFAFADLWIDGEYRGTYMVTEKIEIGTGRVELDSEEAVICELDNDFYGGELPYTVLEDEIGNHFVIKDPDAEDANTSFYYMVKAIRDWEKEMAKGSRDVKSWEEVCYFMDMESLAKVMLVNEYMRNAESTSTSFYLYRNGNGQPVHAGPVWDFDSAGLGLSGTDPRFEYYMGQMSILKEACKYPQFREIYVKVWRDNRALLASMEEKAQEYADSIRQSASMNYLRWNYLGTMMPKEVYFKPSYQENVNDLKAQLKDRRENFVPEFSCGAYNEMFRMYNPNSGEHFYTALEAERDSLKTYGWKYEGIAWDAPMTSSVPVYRLYNPNAGDHHYTTSQGERDFLSMVGWNYEGVGWYSDSEMRTPIYRQYNPNARTGAHNFTTNKKENDMLAILGWKEEGIAFYSLK